MGIPKRSDVIRLRKINNNYFTSLLRNERDNMLKVLLTKHYIKRWSVPACVSWFILSYSPHSMIGQYWLLLNSLNVSSSCIKSRHMLFLPLGVFFPPCPSLAPFILCHFSEYPSKVTYFRELSLTTLPQNPFPSCHQN